MVLMFDLLIFCIELEEKTVESDLEEENLQLRNQIDEMETFLADYGLVWVGSNRSDSDSDSEELEKTDSEYDWDKIIRNVKERVSINLTGSWTVSMLNQFTFQRFLQKNSKKELNDIAGFDKIESKQKNGAQESDNF